MAPAVAWNGDPDFSLPTDEVCIKGWFKKKRGKKASQQDWIANGSAIVLLRISPLSSLPLHYEVDYTTKAGRSARGWIKCTNTCEAVMESSDEGDDGPAEDDDEHEHAGAAAIEDVVVKDEEVVEVADPTALRPHTTPPPSTPDGDDDSDNAWGDWKGEGVGVDDSKQKRSRVNDEEPHYQHTKFGAATKLIKICITCWLCGYHGTTAECDVCIHDSHSGRVRVCDDCWAWKDGAVWCNKCIRFGSDHGGSPDSDPPSSSNRVTLC